MLKLLTVSMAIFAIAGVITAAPIASNDTMYKDLDILNYALTLEHLEDTFYRQGLKKFSAADFKSYDPGDIVYERFKAISEHEATHVQFLTSAITAAGGTPVPQCDYKFPYTDVQGFVALAQLLELTGVSGTTFFSFIAILFKIKNNNIFCSVYNHLAYDGANQYIMNADYRTAAATIVTVEARHSAFLNSITNRSPFPYAFDTPLSLQEVITLAGGLISSCPYDVGIKSYATLNVTANGGKVQLTYPDSSSSDYAYFLWGLSTTMANIGSNGTVTVPKEITPGDLYIFVTSNKDLPSDSNIVAGPAYYSIST